MIFKECIRSKDKFATEISLKFRGKTSRGSIFGGAVSISITSLILAFFIMRALEVYQYDDA